MNVRIPEFPIPECPNVSLVSFYGSKPPDFSRQILGLQSYLLGQFQDNFQPCPIEQVHATLIGCEGVKTPNGILSHWFQAERGETRYVNWLGFLDYLDQLSDLPLQIQIGGYCSTVDYGFLSQNQPPFERSFQLLGNTVVLIGWPFKAGNIVQDLNQFRKKAQHFNLLHKYHRQPAAVDNDFYLRLGSFQQNPSDQRWNLVSQSIREFLATSPPVSLTVTPENLTFVRYRDVLLSPSTTQTIKLRTATPEQLEGLYPALKS
ncbi:MAG: hypothetical protein ACRC8A_15050 [Microcoleaceae cyanobacterium]